MELHYRFYVIKTHLSLPRFVFQRAACTHCKSLYK